MLPSILLVLLITNHMISGEIEINTGVYFQSLPETIAYETSLPIVYEIKYLSVQNIKALRDCYEIACATKQEVCAQFKNSIDNSVQGIYQLNINKTSILANDGESLGWEFQIADRNHIKRMFTTNNDISNLKKRIHSYILPVEIFELKSAHSIDKSLCTSGNIDQLARKIQGVLLFITNLISACHTKHLVPEVLDMRTLNENLTKFKNQIGSYGYSIAVEEISQYYSLPITECMISPNKALIGIHVPVIRKEIKNIELKRLIPARLAWNDLTCSLSNTHTDIAIVTTTSGALDIRSFECDPHRDRLCLLSRMNMENSLTTECISILLTGGSVDSISKLCPITCQDTGRKTRVITSLNQNTFLITHVQGIIKHLYNNIEENIEYEPNYGTIWIELPCNNHSLKFSDNKTLLPTFPCLSKLEKFKFKQIIPTAWTSLKTLIVPEFNSERFPTFNNLKECLDNSAVVVRKKIENNNTLRTKKIEPLCEAGKCMFFKCGAFRSGMG